jgi:hypothetical protein
MLLFALPQGPAERADCPDPREVDGHNGWSVAVACDSDTSRPRLRGPARILFGQALDLNTSDELALQVLPGIGPQRAAAIVRARSERPLTSVSDLARVHGIGPRTVERVASWVEVNERHE